MSTRSSLGIALKMNVFDFLTATYPDVISELNEFCDDRYADDDGHSKRLDDEEGIFFHLNFVKWSLNHKLYEVLEHHRFDDDYLIVHSHSTIGNKGLWTKNPWCVSVRTTTEICFEE